MNRIDFKYQSFPDSCTILKKNQIALFTSERAVAYVSAFSWPETVKNAGFPKKSWQMKEEKG